MLCLSQCVQYYNNDDNSVYPLSSKNPLSLHLGPAPADPDAGQKAYLRGVSFLPAGVMQFTADTPFEAAPSSFNAVPATSI